METDKGLNVSTVPCTPLEDKPHNTAKNSHKKEHGGCKKQKIPMVISSQEESHPYPYANKINLGGVFFLKKNSNVSRDTISNFSNHTLKKTKHQNKRGSTKKKAPLSMVAPLGLKKYIMALIPSPLLLPRSTSIRHGRRRSSLMSKELVSCTHPLTKSIQALVVPRKIIKTQRFHYMASSYLVIEVM